VAKNDRAVQIQVAKALQGAVPDIAAGRIIQQQIVPAFRAGDFAGGLNSASTGSASGSPAKGLPQPSGSRQGGPQRDSRGGGFDFQTIAIFLFIAVPMLGGILSRMMGRKLGALATGAAVGGLGWFLTTSLLVALGIGVAALFMVGIMGVGGVGGGAARGGGPIIWGGGGGFGGGGFGGGGGGFSSGGGGTSTAAAPPGGGDGALAAAALSPSPARRGDAARALGPRGAGRDRAAHRRQRGAAQRRDPRLRRGGLPFSYLRRNASARERAIALFGKLRVWDTAANNGVLIYLLLAEHAIEIVADRGLLPHVDAAAWERIMATMQSAFQEGRFAAGIEQAVDAVDALLVRHFPLADGAGQPQRAPRRAAAALNALLPLPQAGRGVCTGCSAHLARLPGVEQRSRRRSSRPWASRWPASSMAHPCR
jgi:uncharacterized membrane protein YgcG